MAEIVVTVEDAKEILAAGDVFSNFERRLALAVVEQAERVAEYENALNWGTSCLSCSRVLDSSIRDHKRAEEAEEAVATLTKYADSLGELNGEMASNYADALARAEQAEREWDDWHRIAAGETLKFHIVGRERDEARAKLRAIERRIRRLHDQAEFCEKDALYDALEAVEAVLAGGAE